jgi:hypothetical protein
MNEILENSYLIKIPGFNRIGIPDESDTIEVDLNLDNLVPEIELIYCFFREPHECHKGRGNWIIDFKLKDGRLFACKYPKEMSRDRFMEYIKPLLERLDKEQWNIKQ